MLEWLVSAGAGRIIAHVHPDHAASNAIAMAVGLHPTEALVDGEVRWTSEDPQDRAVIDDGTG